MKSGAQTKCSQQNPRLNPVTPGQSLRGLPARLQGGREGVRAPPAQGGAPSKKATVAKFSPEPERSTSANKTKHTTPTASREQLLTTAIFIFY